MTRVYGLWCGGYSYAPPEDTDLETFASIGAAKTALQDRYDSNGDRVADVHYASGVDQSVSFPVVDRASEIMLYLSDPRERSDFYPDRMIRFGPRGGVVVLSA